MQHPPAGGGGSSGSDGCSLAAATLLCGFQPIIPLQLLVQDTWSDGAAVCLKGTQRHCRAAGTPSDSECLLLLQTWHSLWRCCPSPMLRPQSRAHCTLLAWSTSSTRHLLPPAGLASSIMEAQVRHEIYKVAICHRLVMYMLALIDRCKDNLDRETCMVLTVSSCFAYVNSTLCATAKPPGQHAALRCAGRASRMCRDATLAATAQVQAISMHRVCLQSNSSTDSFTPLECSCKQLLTSGHGHPEPSNHGSPDRTTVHCGKDTVLFAVNCGYCPKQ